MLVQAELTSDQLIEVAEERPDVAPSSFRARQQLERAERRLGGPVFVFDPMAAALLAQVLA